METMSPTSSIIFHRETLTAHSFDFETGCKVRVASVGCSLVDVSEMQRIRFSRGKQIKMAYWWVSQNQTYKQEREDGYRMAVSGLPHRAVTEETSAKGADIYFPSQELHGPAL
jgi:hypothetical protein